jgi:formylglycine-generating enzyme required for sulfatase activity
VTSEQTAHAMPAAVSAKEMAWIPGGSFAMGSDDHYPEESPTHRVTVDGFWMDRHTLTNAEFARFARKTGYVTVAERAPNPADYPSAKPDMLIPPRPCSAPAAPGRPSQPRQLVDLCARGRTATACTT